MKTDNQTKAAGWAKVPHGIVDTAIPDMAKMLLWYCYDKPADWTFSVADVVRSLGKTPQCIRRHFNIFTAAGVLKNVGEKQNKHGRYPIYSFAPAQVDAFVKSQLKVNPETDPETDLETDVETNVETNPDIQGSHTNTDIPKLNTEKNNTKTDSNENEATKAFDSEDLKKMAEDLNNDFKSQAPNPLMKEIKSGPVFKPESKSSLTGWDDLSGFKPDA
jgi:predicted transcriptional regulator